MASAPLLLQSSAASRTFKDFHTHELRAGSEYKNNLHAAWANRMMELINSAKLRLNSCDMSGANFERPAPAQQPPPLQSAKLRLDSLTGLPRAQLGGLLCTQAEDMAQGVPGAARAVHRTAFAWANSTLEARPGKPLSPSGKPLSHYDERLATLKALVNKVFAAQYNMQQFLEEQELCLAEDHIALGAASRVQNNEDEARENELLCVQAVHSLVAQERPCAQDKDNTQYLEQENELLCVQAVHSLVAQERPCAQDKDNAQYLEQENDGLRIQAGVFCEREMDTVAAAEPGTGVREMDTTAAASIFAVVHQDRYHYISKSTAADAPTGSTLNEPESRAFTTDPRPHAFGTKNVNLTVYFRAKVKVGPLARIRIDDEVYT